MNQAQKDFIQYSLDETKPLPQNLEKIEWKEFFSFCIQHSIAGSYLGVVFNGIERANIRIPKNVLFEWVSHVEIIKSRNHIVNEEILKAQKWLKARDFNSVVLEGQMNAMMYSHPELRSPGDNDIWVNSSKTQIISTVLKEFPSAKYTHHHIELPLYKDVSVEVHFIPTYLMRSCKDIKLNRYIKEKKHEQFHNIQKFCGCDIACLTKDFQFTYQLLHMYSHLFSTRNNFKQFFDYYYLLKQGASDVEKQQCRILFKSLGVFKFASGIMWIMTSVLGLNEKFLITEPNAAIGREILSEALQYGKFSNGKKKMQLEQLLMNFRLLRFFPFDVISRPFFLVRCKIEGN